MFQPSLALSHDKKLIVKKARIIYRLIEYASGDNPSNPLPYHEVYFYALDALPMSLAIILMCITHPGHVLKGPKSEFPKLSKSQKKAAKRAAKMGKDDEMLLVAGAAGYETGDLEDGRTSPLPPPRLYGQYVNVGQVGEHHELGHALRYDEYDDIPTNPRSAAVNY